MRRGRVYAAMFFDAVIINPFNGKDDRVAERVFRLKSLLNGEECA